MKALRTVRLCFAAALAGTVLGAEPRVYPGLITTTAVTQNRDQAIYDWSTRHSEVLKRNAVTRPDVVILGDSIIHYWGGEPRAPLAWATASWDECFAGWTVTNLGFGWDRTENALWRVEHGELDGIEPRVVVVKIGTNNTAVGHTPEEIFAGIEALCARIHERKPQAKVLLLGILTRRDEPALRPSTAERVNRLLLDRLGGVPWLTVRDFGDRFRTADGKPNPALFADGVHVNAAGYEILGRAIRGELLSLMR